MRPGGHLQRREMPILFAVMLSGMAPKLDIWAVGVLTYWLLCGRTPFAADSIPCVLLNILNGRSALMLLSSYSI